MNPSPLSAANEEVLREFEEWLELQAQKTNERGFAWNRHVHQDEIKSFLLTKLSERYEAGIQAERARIRAALPGEEPTGDSGDTRVSAAVYGYTRARNDYRAAVLKILDAPCTCASFFTVRGKHKVGCPLEATN